MSEDRTPGRRRGRPLGSGLDDAAELAAVADKIVASESSARRVSPTAAMKQCVKGIGPSHLRRLQVKWKPGGVCFIAEARERARIREEARVRASRAAPARNSTSHGYYTAAELAAFGAQHSAIGGMGRFDPVLAAARAFPGNLAQEASRALANTGATGAFGFKEAAALSASVQANAGLASLPGLASHNQFVNDYARMASLPGSSIHKQLNAVTDHLRPMRDLEEPPILRQMREHQELMDRINLRRW